MPMPSSFRDRDQAKFRDAANNKSKIAVAVEGDTGLLEGVSYDEVQATYPSPTAEIYSFLLASTQVAQIEVTYSNSSKQALISVKRVYDV